MSWVNIKALPQLICLLVYDVVHSWKGTPAPTAFRLCQCDLWRCGNSKWSWTECWWTHNLKNVYVPWKLKFVHDLFSTVPKTIKECRYIIYSITGSITQPCSYYLQPLLVIYGQQCTPGSICLICMHIFFLNGEVGVFPHLSSLLYRVGREALCTKMCSCPPADHPSVDEQSIHRHHGSTQMLFHLTKSERRVTLHMGCLHSLQTLRHPWVVVTSG